MAGLMPFNRGKELVPTGSRNVFPDRLSAGRGFRKKSNKRIGHRSVRLFMGACQKYLALPE